MTTNTTAARRLDIRMSGADRALLADIQAALTTPMLPPPPASAIIKAALRDLHARVVSQGGEGA